MPKMDESLRNKILEVLRRDPKVSSEELGKKLHLTRQQIAAIKAHRTMGRYNP